MADARLTYTDGIPDGEAEAARHDLSLAGLECEICRVGERGPYASLEWLIPTAIVLWISKPYLESFLGEMGKDHYGLVKKGVAKLWTRFFGAGTKVPEIKVLSAGGIRVPEYTLKFSVTAVANDGREFKLMLTECVTEEEFAASTDAFLDFLCRHYQGDESAIVPARFCIKGVDDPLLLCLSKETRQIRFLDPLPEDVRQTMVRGRLGGTDWLH